MRALTSRTPRLLILLSLVLALPLANVPSASAAHRQVILLGGQSNMVGGGDINRLPAGDPQKSPLADVLLFYEHATTTPLLPESTWVELQTGGSGSAGFGPELSFGHTLNALDPGGNYALIKHARNGSDVHTDWNPEVSNNVYSVFRDTVDAGLQALTDAGDTYEVVGMLWTQGINDGKDARSATEYQEDLEDLVSDVRLNYGSDIAVFISRLSINMTAASDGAPIGCRIGRDTPVCPDDPALPGYGLNGIRTGQEGVVADDPLAFLIDTDTFGSDRIHFNTSGLISVGEAFAESYFQNVVVPEPSTATIGLVLFVSGAVWRNRREQSA